MKIKKETRTLNPDGLTLKMKSLEVSDKKRNVQKVFREEWDRVDYERL